MTEGIRTVLHFVSDVKISREADAAPLGVPPQTDESPYVGFEADPDGNVLGLIQDR